MTRDGDLPALILPDGTQVWVRDGEVSRGGGLPPIVRPDGPDSTPRCPARAGLRAAC